MLFASVSFASRYLPTSIADMHPSLFFIYFTPPANVNVTQTDGDRGKWLYRAYMVGNANGNLTGRWRDTLSPPSVAGYEGTWVASRRR